MLSLKNKTKYSQSSRVSISSSQNKYKKTLRQKIKAHDRGSQPAGSGGKKKKKIKGNPEGKTHYSCNTVIGQENQKDVSSSRPPLNPPPPPPPSFPSNDHNPSPQSGAVFGSLTYHLKKRHLVHNQYIKKKHSHNHTHNQEPEKRRFVSPLLLRHIHKCSGPKNLGDICQGKTCETRPDPTRSVSSQSQPSPRGTHTQTKKIKGTSACMHANPFRPEGIGGKLINEAFSARAKIQTMRKRNEKWKMERGVGVGTGRGGREGGGGGIAANA